MTNCLVQKLYADVVRRARLQADREARIFTAIVIALVVVIGLGVLLGACSPTETPTPSPVQTPTSPPSPLAPPAPLEAEAIEPVTTSYVLSWEDENGLTEAYNLLAIYEQISDTVPGWALYEYRMEWKLLQGDRIMATGVATNAELGPATEVGSGEYNGPVEIEIPTDRFSGTAELWLKGCWLPDTSGWPTLCASRMFTDAGPPDSEGYLFGQYVEGLPQAVYLPWVPKQLCPPCP